MNIKASITDHMTQEGIYFKMDSSRKWNLLLNDSVGKVQFTAHKIKIRPGLKLVLAVENFFFAKSATILNVEVVKRDLEVLEYTIITIGHGKKNQKAIEDALSKASV